jgi:putative ABC transport system permease protein
VANDGKYLTIAEDPQPYFYVPLAQNYVSSRVLQLRVTDTQATAAQVQEKIRDLDPTMPIVNVQTMKASLEGGTGFFIFRLGATLAIAIGILGLILAVVGVYGVVSYSAAQRTQEIGIRLALGATPRQILALLVRQGLRPIFAGVLIGLVAAWSVSRMMGHMLVGITAGDPITYLSAASLLCLVALLACCIPARTAMKTDPMMALRTE